MDSASRGAAALEAKNFSLAIKEYTAAISANLRAVPYYISRSSAYYRSSPSDITSSLKDAEIAVILAKERGKRELIGQAQLRRGIALFGLERYADAKRCFEWTKVALPNEKSLGIWEIKVNEKLGALSEGDEKGIVNVKEIPNLNIDEALKEVQPVKGSSSKTGETLNSTSTAPPSTTATQTSQPLAPSQGVQTPASKIRHDWYQSNDTITLSLMVKGVVKDTLNVDIQPGSISISFPLPTGADYDFSLDPLFARIDASKSTYKVLSTKIELSLKKAEPGRKWHSLEGTEAIDTESTDPTTADADHAAVKKAALASVTASAPAYPTSSKSGPKNWDKLADELTKKSKPKSKSKQPDGKSKSVSDTNEHNDDPTSIDANEGYDEDDDDEEEEGGDAVNSFFKKLYSSADPDTQRAMMKSYTESNGTALSTNWAEVKKGKVETQPPDGMEAKKWDS
jgi:suppressor of G2 allele of SKP1